MCEDEPRAGFPFGQMVCFSCVSFMWNLRVSGPCTWHTLGDVKRVARDCRLAGSRISPSPTLRVALHSSLALCVSQLLYLSACFPVLAERMTFMFWVSRIVAESGLGLQQLAHLIRGVGQLPRLFRRAPSSCRARRVSSIGSSLLGTAHTPGNTLQPRRARA